MKVHNRLDVSSGFTKVPNELLADTGLSVEARLLWIYLASLPPNWDTDRERIARALGASVHMIKTRLTELANAELIRQSSTRQEDGTFQHELHVLGPVAARQPVESSGRERASGRQAANGSTVRLTTGGQTARSSKTDSNKTDRPKKTLARKRRKTNAREVPKKSLVRRSSSELDSTDKKILELLPRYPERGMYRTTFGMEMLGMKMKKAAGKDLKKNFDRLLSLDLIQEDDRGGYRIYEDEA